MSNYLKNQGTWKLSQLKKLSLEEIKEEFDKLVQRIDTFVPMDFESTNAKLKRDMVKSFSQKLSKNKSLMINDWSLSYSEKKVAEVMEKKPTDKRGMVEAYAHPTYLWLTKYNIVVNWKDISAKVSCLEHALRQNDGLPSDAKDEASYMGLWLKFVINSWKMIKKILRVSSASYIVSTGRRIIVGNPQQDLKDKGVIDSGCSRHMTGNKSYLTDYEEIDGGFVAFGGNSKGGKITRIVDLLYLRIVIFMDTAYVDRMNTPYWELVKRVFL
ncbi:hypothetical protein Tco_0599245 [Tanacetum coccineum]